MAEMTLKTALEVALASETQAREIYETLHGRVGNLMLRDKLKFLAGEERKHYDMLRAVFTEKIGGTPAKPDPSLLPRMVVEFDFEKAELTELWKAAMGAEEVSAEHYEGLAGRVSGRAKVMFNYLANVERSHYYLLKSEYDVLAEIDEYTRTDDFPFGMNLINLGP
ncbi:MAG: ferritin family protein [bacterium]|nr:ferritin family protein [bacterium]